MNSDLQAVVDDAIQQFRLEIYNRLRAGGGPFFGVAGLEITFQNGWPHCVKIGVEETRLISSIDRNGSRGKNRPD